MGNASLTGRLGYFERESLFVAALHNAKFCLYDWVDLKEKREVNSVAPIVANSSENIAKIAETSGDSPGDSPESISADPSIIQVMINRGRILMVLGTLMYAPLYSIDETWKRGEKSSKKVEISINRSSFREAVSPWPTLHHVLFSDSSEKELHAQNDSMIDPTRELFPVNSEENIIEHTMPGHMLISPGDIRTWKGDETLFLLLNDSVSFSISKVFGSQRFSDEITYENLRANAISSGPSLTNLTSKYGIKGGLSKIESLSAQLKAKGSALQLSSSQLYFSSKKLQDHAFVEPRGAAYYLSKGWPLQAFHRALAELVAVRKRLQGTRMKIPRAEYSRGALFQDDICTIPVSTLEGMFVTTNIDGTSADELVLKISPEEAAVLQRTATCSSEKSIKTICSSCMYMFPDLCGLDTVRETLRVDAEAAMRIFQWKCESAGVNMFGDDDDPSRNDDRSKGGASINGKTAAKYTERTDHGEHEDDFDVEHDSVHDDLEESEENQIIFLKAAYT